MSPLDKIKQAGFSLWLESVDGLEDGLCIEPSDKLTTEQLAYLKTNKQTIVNAVSYTHLTLPTNREV